MFGDVPIDDVVGAILAHKLYDNNGKMIFNKGHIIVADDIDVLRQQGLTSITVKQLGVSDLQEDVAAKRIAQAVTGENINMRTPGVGRANITAAKRGILHINVPGLELLNNICDGITIATLREYTLVNEGEMVGLVKVIPFAIPEARVIDVERIAETTKDILSIRPLQKKRVAFIVSGTESTEKRLMNAFCPAVGKRIADWGSEMLKPDYVMHTEAAIADAIQAHADADMIIVSSISAIIDRHDVVPSALERAGGSVTIHGVPVDPGSLLMMGYLGEIPVVGAPGCVKSPKTNVFDWIIPRLLTDERLTRANFVSMGHGGLLQDIKERPMPRSATGGE